MEDVLLCFVYEPKLRSSRMGLTTTKISTKHYPSFVDDGLATMLFWYFLYNIQWVDGVRSKHGFTRKARPMLLGMDPELDGIIEDVLDRLDIPLAKVYGIYMNYYRDGNDFTPNHSHPGMCQVIISLGASRTLTMAKKSYAMANGDVIIFGSSVHGVQKDPSCVDGRISIALFVERS